MMILELESFGVINLIVQLLRDIDSRRSAASCSSGRQPRR
jgi:hypothetical protein